MVVGQPPPRERARALVLAQAFFGRPQTLPIRPGAGSKCALSRPFPDRFSEMPMGLLARDDSENAPVAQLDRASDYESEGRTFESFRARHYTSGLTSLFSLAPPYLFHATS
jgi:hypothetical protein